MKVEEILKVKQDQEEIQRKFEEFLDDVDEMFNLYDAGIKAHKKYDKEQNESIRQIISDKPIIILPVADLHIGHIATDLHELLSHWQSFLMAENIYLILMGDYIEHFILMKDVFGIFEQILTPDMQIQFFRKLISIAPKKILAALTARGHQHDAQIVSKTGYSMITNMLADYGIPCLGNKGLLTIMLNDIAYKVALAHKFPYRSYHNKNHTPHQLMTVEYGMADCAVVAHRHQPAMQEQMFSGRMEHTIRCPTFKSGNKKTHDRYSAKFWNTPRFIRHYCFVFYPEEKKIDTMRLEIAKQYLTWKNKPSNGG